MEKSKQKNAAAHCVYTLPPVCTPLYTHCHLFVLHCTHIATCLYSTVHTLPPVCTPLYTNCHLFVQWSLNGLVKPLSLSYSHVNASRHLFRSLLFVALFVFFHSFFHQTKIIKKNLVIFDGSC